jgi:hypothetical protein
MRRCLLARLAPAAAALLAGCSLLSLPQSEPATAILSKLPDQVPFEPPRVHVAVLRPDQPSLRHHTHGLHREAL